MARLTRDALIAQNSALSAECAELRATLSKARVEYRILRDKLNGKVETGYPMTDKLGRHYRQEANGVRTYPAAQ